ncbi:MAG: thermonuclease family protein [Candidatus Omnitrophica bacterium]|nr:thermonuclease family protein [Candidatus Omnitrophota bacterium]
MKFPLTITVYQKLFDNICAISDQAQAQAALAVNHILVESSWKVGQQIVTVEQKNEMRAEYGAQLLERLANDFIKKYPERKGFSSRNLGKMRQFYQAYPIPPISAELTWSTYQVLSTVKDPGQRAEYEQKSIENGWDSHKLTAAIKEDRVARESLPQLPAATVKPKPKKLIAQCGTLNLAKIVEVSNVHDPEVRLAADVGFYRTFKIAPQQGKGQDLQPGVIVEVINTKSGPAFTRQGENIKTSQRYTYQALVEDVIDGDTLKVTIDFGVIGSLHPRLRLRGINTLELSEEKGLEAKAFVEARLTQARFIIIRTHSTDYHGRFVVDVWYLAGERDPQKVMAGGTYLNQELLDNHLATRL